MSVLGKCAGCGLPIQDNGVEALQQKWHTNCFVCDFCRKPLLKQCVVKYTRPYCVDCEKRLYGNYCEVCDKPIVGQQIHAAGKFFHPNHFICSRCKAPLTGGFMEKDQQVYCPSCYTQIAAK